MQGMISPSVPSNSSYVAREWPSIVVLTHGTIAPSWKCVATIVPKVSAVQHFRGRTPAGLGSRPIGVEELMDGDLVVLDRCPDARNDLARLEVRALASLPSTDDFQNGTSLPVCCACRQPARTRAGQRVDLDAEAIVAGKLRRRRC
jgi:hypothetical protein